MGENDSLSAMVANLIEADLLILLTDTDGLYTADPGLDPDARLIECVDRLDESVYDLARGSKSGLGTGGMYTKIVAADIALRSGTSVVIANGGRENVLAGVYSESIPATWFPTHITPAEGRKRWLLAQSLTAGRVVVDEGAARALLGGGKSLLPVGIVEAQGDFERGALISVAERSGREIARGLCNYSSADLQRILGQRSGEIADLLSYDYGPEFIHRDKMALL